MPGFLIQQHFLVTPQPPKKGQGQSMRSLVVLGGCASLIKKLLGQGSQKVISEANSVLDVLVMVGFSVQVHLRIVSCDRFLGMTSNDDVMFESTHFSVMSSFILKLFVLPVTFMTIGRVAFYESMHTYLHPRMCIAGRHL